MFSNFFIGFQAFPEWAGIVGGAVVIMVLLSNADGEIPRLLGLAARVGGAVSAWRASFSQVSPPPTPTLGSEPATAQEAAPLASAPSHRPTSASLELQGVTVRYGGVIAVQGVDLSVRAGRILGVVGPNGAGKTSLIDAIHGFTPVAAGRVLLDGQDISRMNPVHRARLGLTRTFQNLELFQDLTVRENLLAASDRRDVVGYVSGLFERHRNDLPEHLQEVVRVLDLEASLDTHVDQLSSGDQRLVAVARAVGTRPRIMCLDEPTAGLTGAERLQVVDAIRRLVTRAGLGILIVEHNLDVIELLCDDLSVLSFGQIVASGDPAVVLQSTIVRSAYLGVAESEISESTGASS